MSEWKTTTIGDVLTLQRGFDITRNEQRPGSIPVISSGGIGSYHDTAAAKGPGVIIGRKGTLGKVFYVPGDYWPHDTTLWVKDFKGSYPRFVYYFFRNLDVTGLDVGSANPTLNRNHVHPLPIRWPERAKQVCIADVLGALDDKIAANRKTAIVSLELGLTLYERLVSKGLCTRSVSIAECGRWLSGGTPTTSEDTYWDGDIPWISAASLKSPWIDDSDRKITELGAANGTRLVPEDTIIFVVRGMSLTSEFRIGITRREVAFGQDCKAILPEGSVDAAVLFVAIKSHTPEILGLVDHAGHGTGRLATDLLSKVMLDLPEPEFNAKAAATLRPLIEVGAARQAENRALAKLRNILLPELMSGEIRVRDAEKVVEDAT